MRYVPAGPRADALTNIDREHAAIRVAGMPGKISVFSRPIYRGPSIEVAVLMGEPRFSGLFDPNLSAVDSYYRREHFDAIPLQLGPKRFYAYVNEDPAHLEEFLRAVNGFQSAVVVRDVQRKALPPLADPDPA